MDYNTLVQFKNNINNWSEKELLLGFNIYYKLIGLILVPYENHYISIIINPSGKYIKSTFKNYKIYKQDNQMNNGILVELKDDDNICSYGIPYILIYKKV